MDVRYTGGAMRRPLLALLILFAFLLLVFSWSGANEREAEALGCNLPLLMGDLSGDEVVDASDALWLLRHRAGLFVPGPPCSPEDVDCDSLQNPVDALKILRYVASLSVNQTQPCTPIGAEIPP